MNKFQEFTLVFWQDKLKRAMEENVKTYFIVFTLFHIFVHIQTVIIQM